jgi:threonine synthase
MAAPDLRCRACGEETVTGPTYPPRCRCGGLWEAVDAGRYLDGLPAAPPTPLWEDRELPGRWKREDLSRTGSFKDRGAEVLVRVAAQAGARRAVLDSSGSAALAGAAAAAEAGIALTVHVPASVPTEKRSTLVLFGARVVAEGTRADAAKRALGEATEAFYLSHVHHPAFMAGTSRLAGEILGQLRGRPPATWVMPVGNGSLFLGLDAGLRAAGVSGIRFLAVQATACPGLRAPGNAGTTAAAGIAIADPPRREEILQALSRRDGEVLEVSEAEIDRARDHLWRRGAAVERASAAALAGMWRLPERERADVLAVLTGSGHRGGG